MASLGIAAWHMAMLQPTTTTIAITAIRIYIFTSSGGFSIIKQLAAHPVQT